jgi:hypothetical protein
MAVDLLCTSNLVMLVECFVQMYTFETETGLPVRWAFPVKGLIGVIIRPLLPLYAQDSRSAYSATKKIQRSTAVLLLAACTGAKSLYLCLPPSYSVCSLRMESASSLPSRWTAFSQSRHRLQIPLRQPKYPFLSRFDTFI